MRRAPAPSSSASKSTCPTTASATAAKKVVYDLRAGQICLLENLRFHPEEEKDDETFAREARASSATSTSTTPSAPFTAPTRRSTRFRSSCASAAAASSSRRRSRRSARSSPNPDKPVRRRPRRRQGLRQDRRRSSALLEKVDALVIGGAMANTFLAAQGINMKASKIEEDKLALARTILEKAKDEKVAIATSRRRRRRAEHRSARGQGRRRGLDPRSTAHGARHRPALASPSSRSTIDKCEDACSGTAPWVSSRRSRSRRARLASRAHWPTRRRSPWLAAAIARGSREGGWHGVAEKLQPHLDRRRRFASS